ncbi:hypothetical protein N7U66_03495 [Lacinutrix neustonica]|uniref:Uncharacterized protein n=1 Tax=Lacinutrix neustonica TaxID=2980107 RepID=A0A9E8SDS9_9FLAO|nr:hypothetical protein [Lacinutrix neustonica]WAC02748.1 hypothetical protein N7U66_03495 [Lacinutrix neustonica]
MIFFVTCHSFAQNNSRVDSDGDGVMDRKDLDDDNDGILDTIENNKRKENLTRWKNRINVKSSFNNIIFRSGGSDWCNTINSIPFSKLDFNNSYKVTFNVRGSNDAIIGFGIEENGISYEDVDYGFLFKNNTFKIFSNGVEKTEIHYFKKKDLFKIVYNNRKLKFFQNKILIKSFDVGPDLDFYLDTSFRGFKGGRHGKRHHSGYYNNRGNRISIFSNFTISSVANLDTDNDGIINSLDLDSDGDNCNDVIEAGYSDEDKDGVLGTGLPIVDSRGRVTGKGGYTSIENDYLNPLIKVCPDENEYGIYINTTNLPDTIYDIITSDLTLSNLISGKQNSESFIALGVDDGIDKTVFIKVNPSEKASELNLRFVVNGGEVSNIEVLSNGVWLVLSDDFYFLENSKISFMNEGSTAIPQFTINLINGVQYDSSVPLTVSVNENIDLLGATLEIISPTNVNLVVQPSSTINGFVVDNMLTEFGSYNFVLRIQGKLFKGHFLVKEPG